MKCPTCGGEMTATVCSQIHLHTREMEERAELVDMILDLFRQGCLVSKFDQPNRYDHSCLSAYEDAQAFLIREGRIRPEECVRS